MLYPHIFSMVACISPFPRIYAHARQIDTEQAIRVIAVTS